MTSDAAGRPPPSIGQAFPIGLTLAVAIAMAILIALGVWQLQRLKWKEGLLAHIAALQTAPAQPLAAVLARAVKGEDVNLVRVETDCLPASLAPARVYMRGVGQGGAFTWRPVAACRINAAGYDLIAVDRGVSSESGTAAPTSVLAPVGKVVGVLRAPEAPTGIQKAVTFAEGPDIGYQFREHAIAALVGQVGGKASPLMIVVEREDPAPAGVTPASLPLDIPNNHLNYALTWFGLAAALAGVYAAMLFRRSKPALKGVSET